MAIHRIEERRGQSLLKQVGLSQHKASGRHTARRILYLAWAPFFSGAEPALLLTLRALDPARYAPCVLAGTPSHVADQGRPPGRPCHDGPPRPLRSPHPPASTLSSSPAPAAALRHRLS